jgi:hypothetical protein
MAEVPMGGRTIFEVLSCGVEEDKHVRIHINDGILLFQDAIAGLRVAARLPTYL